ncbi:arf-GAP with Rho-GAP domain, ANK repeat and PH domain-containing protein 1-like [Salminus brasiliensis]|uniref:arf-GAP with Rho-GAP domain, ANK repeat and PH domain-containing protein 1-like n=1 Tax=Salminus brasiliensis TaxID=930266 RepID=UPI003B8338D4
MSSLVAAGSQSVPDWLGGLHLEQYCPAFQEAGLRTLWECRGLTPGQLEHLGIYLKGHRRRILGSLQKLFPSERGLEDEAEREKDGEEEDKPVPMERTKFRLVQGTALEPQTGKPPNHNQNVAPPPIPPRHTANRPPVPFTSTFSPVDASASGPRLSD